MNAKIEQEKARYTLNIRMSYILMKKLERLCKKTNKNMSQWVKDKIMEER